MNVVEIKDLLTELGIAHHADSCNPTFTVHVGDEDSLIDSLHENGPWEFIAHRHSANQLYFRDIKTLDELKTILIGYKEMK